MKDKISVIIPTYNVEKYIKECLDSIFNQTYNNLEVIIIDDKSTDNTVSVVKDIIKDKKNVIFIENKKNSGSSYSRNIGIEKSTGKYLSFIDSDDYIDLNFYEELHNSIIKNKSQIAVSDIKTFNTSSSNVFRCGEEGNRLKFVDNGLAASSCNKLFEKSLFKGIRYYEGRMNEDVSVVLPLLINSNDVSYVKNIFYYYRQRENSKQNSLFNERRYDIFKEVDLTLERIKDNKLYKEYKDIIIFHQIIAIILYILPNIKNKKKYYIKKYSDYAKKYELINNKLLVNLCKNAGKKGGIYFGLLVKYIQNGCINRFILLTNIYNKLHKFKEKKSVIKDDITLDDLINLAKIQNKMFDNSIKVSVVLPNYNYSRFLYQRLYSILYQTSKLYEIIILDDCSTDDSREVIDELVSKLGKYVTIRKIYNKKNSGTTFKQWKKGFDEATGDYVWIAEADDYCRKNFLSTVLEPCVKNKDIVISYTDTAFINTNGRIILKTIKHEIDIQKTGHYDKPFVIDGMEEIKKYSFMNCTIANVSSTIIKKDDYGDFFEQSAGFKQAGDWLFYVNVMSKGKVAYSNKVLNFYRMHGNNVSSVSNKKAHLEEIKRIHSYCLDRFKLTKWNKEKMNERIDFLVKVWEVNNEEDSKKSN